MKSYFPALWSVPSLRIFFRWLLLICCISVTTGLIVSLFLILLHRVTLFRFSHPWLLYFLPFAGVVIHYIYQTVGKSSEKGNDLILEEIHRPVGSITWKMAPVILISTLITHLFGGSAGREGTAVQIGGSIASVFGKWFNMSGRDTKTVLIAGIAAGFGAVFGTPFTGAIFAIEVLTFGKIHYKHFPAALLASMAGHFTVMTLHVHHTGYLVNNLPVEFYYLSGRLAFSWLLLGKVMLAAVAFGMVSMLFIKLGHGIKQLITGVVQRKWLIPLLGGFVIIALTLILGKPDFLGLGIESAYPGAVTLPSAFLPGGADTWSWLWKTIYTAITLATGFKGGEVTPLFYIGATLGHTLAQVLQAPESLFAAIGFIAVFAGATKTPLACTVMGLELFGGAYVVFFATGCFIAFLCSGRTGIYKAQRNRLAGKYS